MKCRGKITAKQHDAVREVVNKDIMNIVKEISMIDIIATARFFNLGKKRLPRYLSTWQEVRDEFEQARADDVIDEKLKEECEYLGLDYNYMFSDDFNYKAFKYQAKRFKKQQRTVSLSEAYNLEKQMKQFEEYQRRSGLNVKNIS